MSTHTHFQNGGLLEHRFPQTLSSGAQAPLQLTSLPPEKYSQAPGPAGRGQGWAVPSPASNQHRPSSMRFNCLFIILARRGYRQRQRGVSECTIQENAGSRNGEKIATESGKEPVLSRMASGARDSVRGPRPKRVAAPRCLFCPFQSCVSGEGCQGKARI